MPSLGERLTVLWRDAGLRVRPGVEPAAIQAFQAKYRVTLPTDMREYFLPFLAIVQPCKLRLVLETDDSSRETDRLREAD